MAKKRQGIIVNSSYEELQPIDYRSIDQLKQRAGVSSEYLRECEKIHNKKFSYAPKKKHKAS